MHVFLSYRRGDDPFAVGRLRDALASRLGEERVFLDVLSVQTGAHFERVIETTIEKSDVVLVVIGDRWESAARGDAAVDFVEMEVGIALDKGKNVVPVLLGNRSMPTREALTGALSKLSSINAHRVRADPDFRRDVSDLIQLIDDQATVEKGPPARTPRALNRWVAALAGGVLLLAGAAVAAFASANRTDSSTPANGTVLTTTTAPRPTSTLAGTTTTAAPLVLYPTAPAAFVELTVDDPGSLPDIAVQVDGYKGRIERLYDNVTVTGDTDPYTPSSFLDWLDVGEKCEDVWWIAVWETEDKDTTAHAELRPTEWVSTGAGRLDPSTEAARAGYLSSNGCEVMTLWAGPSAEGGEGSEVLITIRVQAFDAQPSGVARPKCGTLVKHEAVPLKMCDEGSNVRRVQSVLVQLGIAEIDVDGQFGPRTEAAVKAFQLDRGLPVNGIVTTSTWNALFPGEPVPQ